MPITINGKTYDSLEEMPPNIRLTYERMMGMLGDKNGNGAPDFMEGLLDSNAEDIPRNDASSMLVSMNKFVYQGQVYERLEDLPPEARQKYAQLISALDKNQDGVLDLFQQSRGTTNPVSQPVPNLPLRQAEPQAFYTPSEPVMEEVSSPARRIIIFLMVGLVVLIGLGILGAIYFLQFR